VVVVGVVGPGGAGAGPVGAGAGPGAGAVVGVVVAGGAVVDGSGVCAAATPGLARTTRPAVARRLTVATAMRWVMRVEGLVVTVSLSPARGRPVRGTGRATRRTPGGAPTSY
jgi:hypothetical protein